MRILYLHQYFTTPKMAGGTRSYEMARRLVAEGHEVHMITTSRKDGKDSVKNDWWHETIDGINVHWLPVRYGNEMGFLARIFAFLKFAVRAWPKACDIGGDLVFATSTPLTIALPGVFAARSLGVPMVFEVRDLWPELPIAIKALRNPVLIFVAKRLERFAYENASQIIALSPGMADGVSSIGYPRNKIHVIPNSSDMELFAPNEEGKARFRKAHPELGTGPIVLYAGTFGKLNGVSYLARLASLIKDRVPDARFVAIGGGAYEAEIRATAAELGVLDKNFFMYSRMPKLELADAFQAATVSTSLFIDLPEMWANSANKFFDTLASGTAVAINYGGWQAELLAKHNVGIVMGADPKDGADELAELLENPERLETLGKNALQLAQDQFDRNLLARKFIEVVETAAKEV